MAARVSQLPLGPWPKGEANVIDDTEFTKNECLVARNVLLTPKGHVKPAADWEQRTAAKFSSMYRHEGHTYAVDGNMLVRFNNHVATNNWLANASWTLPVADPKLRFSPGNGRELLFTGGGILMAVLDDTLTDLVTQPPAPPQVTITTGSGGLDPGMYRIAHAYDHGSPMSDPIDVELTEPAKITVQSSMQVYCTGDDGEIMYAAPAYITNRRDLGAVAMNVGMAPMRPGRHVGTFNGRVVTAVGDILWLSEPYQPRLRHPVRGYVQAPANITMLAQVADRLFVGTEDATWVLSEDSNGFSFAKAHEAKVRPTQPAWLETGSLPMGNNVSTPLTGAAVWVTDAGVAVGLPNGSVLIPREGRYIIQGAPPYVMAANNNRVYCLGAN